jgi:hypothetical protein
MYAWMREHALEERKPKDTEEQFIYKARKKAIGPFKQRMWSSATARGRDRPVARGALPFLMKQLKNQRHGRRGEVRHRAADSRSIARRNRRAGGKITAAEKSEGLRD